jgi:hypothetical protein
MDKIIQELITLAKHEGIIPSDGSSDIGYFNLVVEKLVELGFTLEEKTDFSTIKMYLHSDKESNYQKGSDLGLTGDVLRNFTYALYEVTFDVEVNRKTGEVKIISVDGHKLVH